MKISKTKKLSLCFLFLLSLITSAKSSAESYVGIQGGLSFANKIDNLRTDVNTSYPGERNSLGPVLIGTKLTDAKVDKSGIIGLKLGHYSNKFPFIGIEGELNYSKPDLTQQVFTATNPSYLPAPIRKPELKCSVQDLSVGASVMFRYPVSERIKPYIGVGPTLHYYRFRGSGNNAVDPTNINTQIPGPEVRIDTFAPGLQAKVGVMVLPTKRVGIDLNYKYSYNPFVLDKFRSLENVRGNYGSHQVMVGLIYRFGKI